MTEEEKEIKGLYFIYEYSQRKIDITREAFDKLLTRMDSCCSVMLVFVALIFQSLLEPDVLNVVRKQPLVIFALINFIFCSGVSICYYIKFVRLDSREAVFDLKPEEYNGLEAGRMKEFFKSYSDTVAEKLNNMIEDYNKRREIYVTFRNIMAYQILLGVLVIILYFTTYCYPFSL